MQMLKRQHGSKNCKGTLILIIPRQVGHMAQEIGRNTSAVCQAKNIYHFPGTLLVFLLLTILSQKSFNFGSCSFVNMIYSFTLTVAVLWEV